MRYLRFLPALAVLAGVATLVTFYSIFASVFGSSADYYLSSVLSVGCDPEPNLQLAYSLALVGFGAMLLLLAGVAFFRGLEDRKAYPRLSVWAELIAYLGFASFFVMVAFPSGGFDGAHRFAAGASVFFLTLYALLTWRRGRWVRNLVVAFVLLEAFGMMITWILALAEIGGSFRWNLFAIFQLQFGVFWFLFVLLLHSRADFVFFVGASPRR